MGEFSLWHMIILLAIVLLVFGPGKLPHLGSSLGKAIRGFKSALNDADPTDTPNAATRPEQIDAAKPPVTHVQNIDTKVKDPTQKS